MSQDSIAVGKPDDVGISRERLGVLQDAITREIDAGRIPGAVSLVARRGRIVHFKAAGLRNPVTGAAMELDTIFRIFSMTKPIVSVLAMQLVEDGKLRLSDPLHAYLPGFAEMGVMDEAGAITPAERPITIQDLLRHTSGLVYEFDGPPALVEAYNRAGVARRDRTNADHADALAALPLAAQPGTRWGYGRSTDIVGRVIEVVTGETLGAALASRIFGPLAMADIGFALPPEKQARLAEPFPDDPDGLGPVSLFDPVKPALLENAGGGLVATMTDYARFLHMLSSDGTFEGTRILGPKTLAYMASDHLPPGLPRGSDLLPEGYGFGLGFAVRTQAGLTSFPGSAGDCYWEGLAGTTFWVDPAEDLYALLMVQAPGRRDYLRRTFRSLVYAALTD